jgi:hypothetical protein
LVEERKNKTSSMERNVEEALFEAIRQTITNVMTRPVKDDPTFLPSWLYDEAERHGYDLTKFCRIVPIPETGETSYVESAA